MWLLFFCKIEYLIKLGGDVYAIGADLKINGLRFGIKK